MTHGQPPPDQREPWVRLATRALTPDFKQYFICYSTAKRVGLQMVTVYSPNPAQHVQDAFEYNEYERGLQVHFCLCSGDN